MIIAAASEAESEIWAVFLQLVMLLGAALLLGMLFEKLRQSAILGYLLAGTLLGPSLLNVVQAGSGVPIVAELGVSMLLFAIGLEFSVKRLIRLGSLAVLGGTLQVSITLAAATGIALACGLEFRVSVAVGAMVALSSTACVLRVLVDRAEVDSVHGRAALGILLLQDVAVVPLLLLVTMFGEGGTAAELGIDFAKAVGLIAALIAVFYGFANYVLPRIMSTLSLSRDRELLILLAVVLAIGSACAAHALDVSPALGAFMAGMLLAESPFATQIRSDISALRALFLTLFFASVGMLGDPVWMFHHAWQVGLVVALIVFGKAIVVAVIAIGFGRPTQHAVAAGVSLAQVGEFGVVIAGIAQSSGLMGDDLFQLLVSATLISLFLTPILVRSAIPIGRAVQQLLPKKALVDHPAGGDEASEAPEVILVGFGPSGQRVAEELVRGKVPALVIDLRPPNVDLARSMGLKAALGDATNLELLLHHGITKAKAIVICVPDHRAAVGIVKSVRTLAPGIGIVVRARYHPFVPELEDAGATAVVNEERHTGRRLAAALRAVLAPGSRV